MFAVLHLATPMLAAFLAALVEFVEALTIVLAVGTVRGWRPALYGAALGALILVALVLIFGPLLMRFPIANLQIIIGLLLLLFGLRWLRKATLRFLGLIPLHDETAAFNKETQRLQTGMSSRDAWDPVAVITSFKAVVLEGLEVVFIVIATGSTGSALLAASVGASAALVLVVIIGVALHRPLARVPENTLKFCVGVLLSAFGTFWFGEGLGFEWPGRDIALLALVAGYLVAAVLAINVSRHLSARQAGLSSEARNA